jgi:acylglycerol lipase
MRIDDGKLARSLRLPVCEWQCTGQPRAIVLAIHGLTMHGTVYDAWARQLAAQQIMVAAPDLRGYGQWCDRDNGKSVDYQDSEKDLVALAQALRAQHPRVPLFLAGESLGGAMAVRIAGSHSDLVDGLILSAPALKHYHQIPLSTLADGVFILANPAHKVNISGYIKHYFSDDPAITKEAIADPLIRKHLNVAEIVSSCRIMGSSAEFIKSIPADMPILVIQGEKDRMVKPESVLLLQRDLKTKKQTVCWLPERGHILLETAHLKSETVETINCWLKNNCVMRTLDSTTVASSSGNQNFAAKQLDLDSDTYLIDINGSQFVD